MDFVCPFLLNLTIIKVWLTFVFLNKMYNYLIFFT